MLLNKDADRTFFAFTSQTVFFKRVSFVTGMLERNLSEEVDPRETERLQQLSAFQITILSHALSFPCARRVVYSTCSIHAIENENVVEQVLRKFGGKFELERVLPDWSCRGLNTFEWGEKCLRMSPETTNTHGFFVACFVKKDFSNRKVKLVSQKNLTLTNGGYNPSNRQSKGGKDKLRESAEDEKSCRLNGSSSKRSSIDCGNLRDVLRATTKWTVSHNVINSCDENLSR